MNQADSNKKCCDLKPPKYSVCCCGRNQIMWCGAGPRSVRIIWVQRAPIQNILYTPRPSPDIWSVQRPQVLKFFLLHESRVLYALDAQRGRVIKKYLTRPGRVQNDFWSDGPKPKNIPLLWTMIAVCPAKMDLSSAACGM